MSAPAEIVLYTTTFAATVKIRSDISKIKHILNSKKIFYEEVDLTELPYRRRDMLAHSDNNPVLPQLHVNNRFIGTVDELQEFEDWGELDAILRGVSPGKLAAAAAEAFQAAAAAAAEAPVSPVPRFTLEEEDTEEAEEVEGPSAEGSEEELEIAVPGAAAVAEEGEDVEAVSAEEEEPEAEEASIGDDQGLNGEPEAANSDESSSEGAASADEAAEEPEPLEEPEEQLLADTVDPEGAKELEGPADEEGAAAPTPDRAAPEHSPAQLFQSPISPLSDVDTEVPIGDDPGVSTTAPEQREEQEEPGAAAAGEDLEDSELLTPLRAHRLGEDLHARPVEGELFPSPEKRPQSGQEEEEEVSEPGGTVITDNGHLIA